MRILISLSIVLFTGLQAFGQSAALTVTVSNDSVLLGNIITVIFAVENTPGDGVLFPDFAGFNQVSGPNVSTSMRITNGQMSQSASYTFYLEPLEIGDAYIEPASLETADDYLETPPLLIRVYPNPDGIIQPPNNQQQSPSMFGNDPFNNDFFKISPFRNPLPFDGNLFDNFFNDIKVAPFQRDSTIIEQPKKRKTIRI